MDELLQAERTVTATQITSHNNQGMQKSVSANMKLRLQFVHAHQNWTIENRKNVDDVTFGWWGQNAA